MTIHDGGEDVLEDGRRLYAAETLRLTASDRDPATATLDADVVYRWTDAGRRHRDPRQEPPDQRRRRVRHHRGPRRSTLDGEPFFERSWQERIPRQLV